MKLHLPVLLRKSVLTCLSGAAVCTMGSGAAWGSNLTYGGGNFTWDSQNESFVDEAGSAAAFDAGDTVTFIGAAEVSLGETLNAGKLIVADEASVNIKDDGSGNLTLETAEVHGTLKLCKGGINGAFTGDVDVYGTLDFAAGDVTGWSNSLGIKSIDVFEGGTLHVSVAASRWGNNQTGAGLAINLQGSSITGVSNANLDLCYGGSAYGYSSISALAAEDASAENPTVSSVSGTILTLRQNATTISVAENAFLDICSGIGEKSDRLNGEDAVPSGTTAGLTKIGAGELRLSGANTYTQATTVAEGTLTLTGGASFSSSSVTVKRGAVFKLDTAADLELKLKASVSGSGTLLKTGGGRAIISTLGESFTGDINLREGSLNVGSSLTISGQLNLDSGTIFQGQGISTLVGSAAEVRLQNAELSHAGYNLNFNAGTTLELAGSNTIRGNVQMLDNSILSFDLSSEAGYTSMHGDLQFGENLTLALNTDSNTLGTNVRLLWVDEASAGWDGASLTVLNGIVDSSAFTWVKNFLVLNYDASSYVPYYKESVTITNGQDSDTEYRYYTGVSFENIDGGAICGFGDITLSDNGSVEFIRNTASSGGAIYGGYRSTITLAGNESVMFCGNTASGSYPCGGAIYGLHGTITLSNNGSVSFIGNTAASSDDSYLPSAFGGAIDGGAGTITLCDNGNVEFRGNKVLCAYNVGGGAIYTYGSLIIRNNDSVLFEKNVQKSNSGYRLRSVLVYGGSGDTLSLSAAAGKSIEFHDSVYVGAGTTVNLNEEYTFQDAEGKAVTVRQTGDIIFTGKYAKAHLNEILETEGAGRSATPAEIRNSLTTEVKAMTNLYGGRLRVEDGAVYTGYGITAMEGSAATVRVQNAELSHAGYNLNFNAGTTLELAGSNTIRGNVQMQGGSYLSIDTDAGIGTTDIFGNLQFAEGSSFSLSSGNAGCGSNEVLLYTTGEVAGWEGVQLSLPGKDSLTWVDNLLVLNYQASTFNRYFNGSASYDSAQTDIAYYHYEALSFAQCDSIALTGSFIFIRDNEKVLFEKNAGFGTCLRSINSTGSMELAAPEGGEIRFHDGTYVAGAVYLNSSVGRNESTGSIILDGSLAGIHYAEVMGRDASAKELQLSRTHQWKNTTLHNGILQVQGNAYLDASSMIVSTGELNIDSANIRAKSFVLETGARLSFTGSNYVQLGAADLRDGSILSFSNLSMMDNRLEGEIDFANLTIRITDKQLAEGSYKLFTLTHSSSATWDANTITLEGVDAATASLVWNKGSLYLNYGNTPNAMPESILWQDDRIQAEADFVCIDSLEDWENNRLMGSQKLALTQDFVASNVLIDANLNWGRQYELTSADKASPVDLELRDSTTGAWREVSQALLIHSMDNIRFLDNSTNDISGGAIYAGVIELRDNGSVELCGNSVNVDVGDPAYGGAIHGGEIILSDNSLVRVENNSANNGYHIYGGAIVGEKIILSDNGDVIFRGNSASNNLLVYGGAICGFGDITLTNNGSVTFCGNTASSLQSKGGAIDGSRVTLSDNGSVSFSENTASGSSSASGGAIYRATITLSNNGSVVFEGNTASSSSSSAEGGAIYGSVTMTGNGDVSFSGNTASGSFSALGGAIYTSGNLSIQNNDSVLFEKNAEISKGSYRLRSVYMNGGSGDNLSLSASAGKSIEFRDSMYVGAGTTVNLNEKYGDVEQTGDIIFTGATTVDDLFEVKNGEYGTDSEVLASRTTEVYAMTNIYGGRLRVEDGAIYQGQGIMVHEGSDATVRVKDAELSHVGYELEFNAGTTLEVAGESTIRGNVNLQEGGVFKLELGAVLCLHETAGDDAASLSVSGTALLSGTSTLNASLTLLDGSTLDMDNLDAGAVALNGVLTFGGQVTLGENLLALLDEKLGHESSITLFTGLENVDWATVTGNTVSDRVWAGAVFSNMAGNHSYYLNYASDTGSLVMQIVPEPATATLSLLALAGLAARRRRK